MQVTSAQAVEIEGARATIRNPVALWILTLLTLGILGAFWWYGINREVRDVSRALGRPLGNSPVFMAVLAGLWPLAWIPAVISIYLGSRWIRTLEEGVGTSGRIRPVLAALLFPLLFVHVIYVQRSVNEVWRRAAAGACPAADWTVTSGTEEAVAAGTRAQAQREAERWR
jgi:Domain of unknown function (DUF4234)